MTWLICCSHYRSRVMTLFLQRLDYQTTPTTKDCDSKISFLLLGISELKLMIKKRELNFKQSKITKII